MIASIDDVSNASLTGTSIERGLLSTRTTTLAEGDLQALEMGAEMESRALKMGSRSFSRGGPTRVLSSCRRAPITHIGPSRGAELPAGNTTSAEFTVRLPTLAHGPATTCASFDGVCPHAISGGVRC